MTTTLNQLSLFPSTGQPYTVAPWNYGGTEGAGWSPSDYPSDAVDWVLVSIRTSADASTTVSQVAGLLRSDGTVSVDLDITGPLQSSYFVVIEHRNHLIAMSPNSLPVNNSEITYDFTTANSYTGSSGFGQKLIAGKWFLFSGNEEQTSIGHEITGADILLWQLNNGTFNIYSPSDLSLDGDVNANDKIIWSFNNGIFSGVPK